MTYPCPSLEYVAEIQLMKLHGLQSKILHTTGNFPRGASVHDMHVAFQITHIYDCIIKLCRQQAEVIQNHENVLNNGQGKA
jgi:hypothetical protein